ncbi:acyl-CoA dehydrogenase family protein [Ammoniphilus sp. YIM 78166]|uniref:acyl-CoA dehydrogenase family protein n=1 Tax=Ammoniphilus sp. YIM 78166 TaxID=1644106 RepID=UPI0010701B8B|nr:acyl-CoA dehydrogenase family protein [Ammoniphilus sp. YIM 78166]
MTIENHYSPTEIAQHIAQEVIAPLAAKIDREQRFPSEAFDALGKSGLLGLLVPKEFGGLGGSLSDLSAVTQVMGQACGSTSMCFLMHSVATMVIASRAQTAQQQEYLRSIAQGEKIGTLAFSERGTGAHFYSPEITANFQGDHIVLNGKKSFVTNGDHADFLVVVTNASSPDIGLDMLLVETASPGVQFTGSWDGIGLRGNNSIAVEFTDVKVPLHHVIGKEGDGLDLIFQVVAPTFILGIAGMNVGLAKGAYHAALDHAKARKYADGRALCEIQAIQFYLAEMHGSVESASLFVQNAARAADAGEEAAILSVMQSKIQASEQAIKVTNLAMQVCGGQGYTSALPVERYLRDARAGAVMAPTTEVLKEWVGKSVADLPLF